MGQPSSFGGFVRFLREKAGISSQRELGRRAKIGESYAQQLESGYVRRRGQERPVTNPSWEIVNALADAFDEALPDGLSAEDRRTLFESAGLPEQRDDLDPETYGLSPKQARALASLPAAELLQVLERASRATGGQGDALKDLGIRFKTSPQENQLPHQQPEERGQSSN